jgi:hypothetical protein
MWTGSSQGRWDRLVMQHFETDGKHKLLIRGLYNFIRRRERSSLVGDRFIVHYLIRRHPVVVKTPPLQFYYHYRQSLSITPVQAAFTRKSAQFLFHALRDGGKHWYEFSSTKPIKGDRRLPTTGYAVWINYWVRQQVRNWCLNIKFYDFKLKCNL